jgi:hypothetical protein
LISIIFLSFIIPVLLKTNVNYWTIFIYTLFEGLTSAVSFYFIMTFNAFLSAKGETYIVNIIALINKILCNVAKIILGNKNLIAKLAGNSQNMANFQNIISRLVQSAARPKNGFLSYVTPIDFFTSERRQLEKMGFSPEEAEDL